MLPDYPNRRNPRAFWFSHNDQKLSLERLLRHQRAQPKVVTWASAKRTFSTWLVYCITILFASTVLATYGYVYFGLFLKALKNANGSKRWTSEQVNVISSVGGGAINLAFGLLLSLSFFSLSDTHTCPHSLLHTHKNTQTGVLSHALPATSPAPSSAPSHSLYTCICTC